MIDGSVANVVFIHQLDNIVYSLNIVSSIAIQFDIENMPTSCQLMVRTFHSGFMLGTAMVIDGHVI